MTGNCDATLPQAARPAPAAAAQDFSSAWLSDLHYDWSALKQYGQPKSLKKDEILFLQESTTDTVYIVEEGRIRLVMYSPEGAEQHIAVIGSNGLVGDCGLFSAGRQAVSAVASSTATVLGISCATLMAAIQRHPAVMRQYLELADIRFRLMLRHHSLLSTSSVQQRVCYHLLGLMHSYGVPHRCGQAIRIVFTQQEMAYICGISRVSVCHMFAMLEAEHIITHEGRLVVIRDPGRLREKGKLGQYQRAGI